MFNDLLPVVEWLFSEISRLFSFVWSCGWIGVIVICLPLARKVVDIFRKIL